jgi:hypothetical protein
MAPVLPIILIVIAGLTVALVRRGRARHLARLRERWGRPVVRTRKLEAIVASYRSRLAGSDATDFLDDRTWDDLNLDDVFAALDRTESTLGQHALYYRLRMPPAASHLDAFEALVARFDADPRARERAQLALSGLHDPHGYDLWWLARRDASDMPRWGFIFPVLTLATVAIAVALLFSLPVIPALVGLLIVNAVARFLSDRRSVAVAAAFRQIAPVITAGQKLQFLAGDGPLVGTLRLDAHALRGLKLTARWISGDPFMLPAGSGAFAMLINDVVHTIYEYLNLFFLLDATGAYLGSESLRAGAPALLRLMAASGEVDAALSVASLRAGRRALSSVEGPDWTTPRFAAPGATAVFSDVRHPLVPDAVPNTITVAPGHGAIITGSNMSGKTTFLRTIGVATIMAQTLNTCLATEYNAPIFLVRSCIGRSDDLISGKSYYIVEVEALLRLVAASATETAHLFLLDELFRGTNAVERIAAGQAVLRELTGGPERAASHFVLAATHDAELVDLLADRYAPFHFGDASEQGGLTFDHRLQPGRATTRNAIALLRIYGAPERLITRALACAADLDRQRGTTLTGR